MSRINSRERLVQSVILGLRGLDTELDLMNQVIAEVAGLNRTDAQCMDIISGSGGITPGALAQRIGLTPGAVTTILDRLEAGGWVVRRRDTADRRRVLVRPSPSKHRRMRALMKGLQLATRNLTRRYSDEQLELVLEFLQRTATIVSEHRRSLRE